jgi:hypothetical protein
MSSLFHRSGLMSGMWKRSMAKLVRHRRSKGPETDRPSLKPPRHISTLPSRMVGFDGDPHGVTDTGECGDAEGDEHHFEQCELASHAVILGRRRDLPCAGSSVDSRLYRSQQPSER